MSADPPGFLVRIWQRIEASGQRPSDSPQLQLAKRTAVRTEIVVALLGIGHFLAMSFALGLWSAAAVGFFALGAQALTIWWFDRDGNLRRALGRFTLKSLLLVFLMRFSLRALPGSEMYQLTGLIIVIGSSLSGKLSVILRVGGMVLATVIFSEAMVMAFPAEPVTVGPLLYMAYIVSVVLILSLMATMIVLPLTRGRSELTHALEQAHERSERLLLNVLPPPIAERLKTTPGTIADRFDAATVLFADIVGFTPLSADLPPEELVRMLDAIFSEFDGLAEKHGLEKIKTIGDAYMVAGGIPEEQPGHVEAVARMALDMREAARRWPELQLRIGMHTGPVVAGVIGQRKFAYDLWGDTVNTASRMESHGIPGVIQVTDAVRDALAARFEFASPRVVEVKGKGEMHTWQLVGPRP